MNTDLVTQPNNPLVNAQQRGGALVDTESQRAIQEVQAALVIAKRFPRDEKASLDRILNSCTRPSLANQALYSYSRGGSEITGPSIRLAEAVAQQWGNIQFGIKELEQSNGTSTVEAFAWDVETNTRQVKIFQVAHERHTRNGTTKLKDPRDIYELVANNGARRLRACILGVIPGDIIEEAQRQCEATMSASADTSPEAMARMVEGFAEFNITREQIEKRIQRRIDSIVPAQVIALRKIYRSLKDGMSAPSDWFDVPQVSAPETNPFEKAPAKSKAKPQPAEESAAPNPIGPDEF